MDSALEIDRGDWSDQAALMIEAMKPSLPGPEFHILTIVGVIIYSGDGSDISHSKKDNSNSYDAGNPGIQPIFIFDSDEESRPDHKQTHQLKARGFDHSFPTANNGGGLL